MTEQAVTQAHLKMVNFLICVFMSINYNIIVCSECRVHDYHDSNN